MSRARAPAAPGPLAFGPLALGRLVLGRLVLRRLVLGRLLLGALALGAPAAGCGAGTRSPTGAVRALAEAAQDGDRAAAFRLLGPATRTRLDADAKRAAQLSGRRAVAPEEMLAVGWFPARFHLDDARERSRSGGHATVEVVGAHGEREQVACVEVGGSWKVELP